MLKFAGRFNTPQGIITHVGRKSGRTYATPIAATPIPNGFIIALPYGTDVDWCRNILAADTCTLQWHSTTYNLVKPQVIDAATVVSSMPPANQAFFRLFKVNHVLKLELSTAPADYATPAL